MEDSLIVSVSNDIFNAVVNSEQINFKVVLTNILKDIINKLNLQLYVSEVVILDVYEENASTKGLVDKDGNIKLFGTTIENGLNEILEEIPALSEVEINLCRYLLYLKTFLHELEHVKQNQVSTKGDSDSLEDLLIKICNLDREKDGVGYFCLYDTYPTERLAEIHAYRTIIKIIEFLEKKLEIILLASYLKKEATLEEFYNYYKYGLMGPTECFLDFWAKESLVTVRKIKDSKALTLKDKTLLGLEISRKEYEQLVLEYGSYEEIVKKFSSANKK